MELRNTEKREYRPFLKDIVIGDLLQLKSVMLMQEQINSGTE